MLPCEYGVATEAAAGQQPYRSAHSAHALCMLGVESLAVIGSDAVGWDAVKLTGPDWEAGDG